MSSRTLTFRPDRGELLAAAVDKLEAPAVFADANERVAVTAAAARAAVQARHELIREARGMGVSWVALSRWTGINPRTLHDIVAAGHSHLPNGEAA